MSRDFLRDTELSRSLTEVFSGSALDRHSQNNNSHNIAINPHVNIVDKLTNQRIAPTASAQKTENLAQNIAGTAGAKQQIENTQGLYVDEARKARTIALGQMKQDHGADVTNSVGRLQGGDFEQALMFAADASLPLVREASSALMAVQGIAQDRKATPAQRMSAIRETRDKLASESGAKNPMAMPTDARGKSSSPGPQRFDKISTNEMKQLLESKPEDMAPPQLEQQKQFLAHQMNEQQVFEGSRALDAAVNFEISGSMAISVAGLDAIDRETILGAQNQELDVRRLNQEGAGLAGAGFGGGVSAA